MDKTGICNFALLQIGVATIRNWETDSSKAGPMIRTVYDTALRSTLASSDWAFARKHLALSELSGESFTNWDKVYSYPSDCIKTIKIEAPDVVGDPVYQIRKRSSGAGRCIVTNESDVVMIYTARIDDPGQYPDKFSKALGWHLAHLLAYPLRNDMGLRDSCWQMYQFALSDAGTDDANEGVTEQDDTCDFVDARD